MQYFVHVYHVVRTKISIEADNHVEAMKQADHFIPTISTSNIPFEEESKFQGHSTIHHTEGANEVISYLVDEVGDTEYSRSVSYGDDYRPSNTTDAERLRKIRYVMSRVCSNSEPDAMSEALHEIEKALV